MLIAQGLAQFVESKKPDLTEGALTTNQRYFHKNDCERIREQAFDPCGFLFGRGLACFRQTAKKIECTE